MSEVFGFKPLFFLWKIISLLPSGVLFVFFRIILALILLIKPKYKKIIFLNLTLSFPHKTLAEKEEIFQQLKSSMSWMLVDALKVPFQNENILKSKFEFEDATQFKKACELANESGALFLSAHLGSFFLSPIILKMHNVPLAIVGRYHKSQLANAMLEHLFSCFGNRMIPRNGALRRIIKELKAKRCVGLLFDQNVVRKDAVFVPWFGVPAATTVALGVVALKVCCPIYVVSTQRLKGHRYRFKIKEINYSHILSASEISQDAKIIEITKLATEEIEKQIAADIGSWFWMHRRWKTRPEGELEAIYKGI